MEKEMGNSLAWSGGPTHEIPATDRFYQEHLESIKNTGDRSGKRREEDLPVVQTRSDKKKKRGRKREGGFIGRRMAGTRAVKRGNEGGEARERGR